MRTITLGATGIQSLQNAFGALPIQRISADESTALLRRAFEAGMTFYDTARAYTDSEEKIGLALSDVRDRIHIATKTMAQTPEAFWSDLETSLANLKTDYVDIHQFHCMNECWRPGDGTGMYECMLEAKAQGKVRHIGATAHKLEVAFEIVESGLYETLQYPFSYLASPREKELVALCKERKVGFIAMKGLAGGLLSSSRAIMAFMDCYENVLPIWGIQRSEELEEWLAFMDDTPRMDEETASFIKAEQDELMGDFCRGCGYCKPCPVGIEINQCARMSLMIRRAKSDSWLGEHWQNEMSKIEDCTECRLCTTKCPYELDIPELLKKNYEDYQNVLAGKVSVSV